MADYSVKNISTRIARVFGRIIGTGLGFKRLHDHANRPEVQPLCLVTGRKNIYTGMNVRFERGAIVSAGENGKVILHDNVCICRSATIEALGGVVEIGRNSCVGDLCSLYGCAGLSIGNDVLMASGVRIVASSHTFDRLDVPIRCQPQSGKGIVIGNDVWIGFNVVILDGVHIGHGAVIGAGAVVTRDIPDYAIAAGVPARVLRSRVAH